MKNTRKATNIKAVFMLVASCITLVFLSSCTARTEIPNTYSIGIEEMHLYIERAWYDDIESQLIVAEVFALHRDYE